MMKLKFAILMTALTCLGTSPLAHAAFGGSSMKAAQAPAEITDPLQTDVHLQPSAIEAGGTADVVIDLNLAPHYHAYLERFKLIIESPDDVKLAPFKVTPVVSFMDVATKTQKQGIEGKAQMRALIEVPPGFAAGQTALHLKLTYQACTEDHCLFPKTLALTTPLTINAGPGAAEHPRATTPTAAPSEFESALNRGLLPAFLLVFVVGFLTSLTPCIYPMIPITLAVLGARKKEQSHLRSFSLALVYVLGIAFTYACLGLVAASTGSLFGSALSNIWVVTAIAIVFVAMGLSMFGLFEVQAPAFIRDRLGAARSTSGLGGAFATGLLAGVVASPCIGPVLVSVLAYIAQTQSRALGFFMLFTFAIGMGVPFIVLGLSTSLISRLPKAGSWMESVKFIFGVLMISMAFYYVKPLYPTWLFHLLAGIALVGIASQFGAFLPNAGLTPARRLQKGAMVLVLFVGAGLGAWGVLTRAGWMPTSAPSAMPVASAMPWKPYSDQALEDALAKHQPVLIDFSAEWCGACKEMDRTTFVDPKIVELGHRFTLLRVDGTDDTKELQRLITRFGIQGFPTYLFYDVSGKARPELSLFGAETPENFRKRLDSALCTGVGINVCKN